MFLYLFLKSRKKVNLLKKKKEKANTWETETEKDGSESCLQCLRGKLDMQDPMPGVVSGKSQSDVDVNVVLAFLAG